MLCDTGPMVSLQLRRDPYHLRAKEALSKLPLNTTFVVTWPCLTEAMYFLGREEGLKAQEALWKMIELGAIVVRDSSATAVSRIRDLMNRYSDAPMDIADASLVHAAEEINEPRIFTFDEHFRTYLIHDKTPFQVFPH